jgi:hypothetical protein
VSNTDSKTSTSETKTGATTNTSAAETINLIEELKYTSKELAKKVKLHPTTVRKMFRNEPGVICFGREGDVGRGKNRRRPYFSLRIPASVAARVLEKKVSGAKTGMLHSPDTKRAGVSIDYVSPKDR